MTQAQSKIVSKIKGLIDDHDTVESALTILTRAKFKDTDPLWVFHDMLERKIIEVSAKLPQSLVEKLKRGEL